MLQGVLVRYLRKKKRKPEGKQCPTVFCETSLTGLLSHPWRLSRLGSHCRTGLGYTQPGRVPFIKHFKKFYCVLHVAGSRVPCGIKTLRNFKENSAGLNLCWSWGSQFKIPPSWQCLLAPKHPQRYTVDPEGISLHGPFVRSFRWKK